MRKVNIYYLFDFLLALSIVFLLLSRKHVRFLYGSAASVFTTALFVLLEMEEKTQLTQTVVTNNSDKPVLFKPESESEPKEIAPHTSAEGVDGIKVNGKVFKTCSGTHVVIGNTGKITTKALSGKVANIVRGGYISSTPDSTWQPLFDA